MQPCKKCGFEYDHRKANCPQCTEPTRVTKAELDALQDEDFKLKDVPAPESPSIDRQGNLEKQISLAKEKREILKQQLQMKSMEDRLAEIQRENEELEAQIGRRPDQQQAPKQDGGASGKVKTKPPHDNKLGSPPGFAPRTPADQPQLFYADGSPASPSDQSAQATSTLQAGLESVGLGLQ